MTSHADADYPDFVFDYCTVVTWNEGPLDRALSSVCSTFIPALSTPKSTVATSTTALAANTIKLSSTLKSKSTTSAKSSVKTSTTTSKINVSTKKTSTSTKKTTTSTKKTTTSTKNPASSALASIKKSTSATLKSVSVPTKKTSSASTGQSSKTTSSVKQTSTTQKSSIKAPTAKSSGIGAQVNSATKVLSSVGSVKTSSATKALTTVKSSSSSKVLSSTSKAATSTTSTNSTTLSLAPAATAVLIPVVHYDTDTSDLDNLIPQNSSALYYAEQSYLTNPYLQHLYLHMQVNFTYPTVVLEHSSHLTDFSCWKPYAESPLYVQITMQIDTYEAWQVLHKTWLGLEELVLVSNGDGCSTTSNNTRSYWLGQASDVTWRSDLSPPSGYFTFHGDEIFTQNGLADADLVWGTVIPAKNVTSTTNYGNSSLCSQTSDPNNPTLAHINPCTPNFDQVLDQQIGYAYKTTSDRYNILLEEELFAPGMISLVRSQNTAAASADTESDGWFSTVLGDLEDFVVSAAESVENFVDSWIPSIPDGKFTIDMAPSPVVESSWGDAYQIYKYPSKSSEKRTTGSTSKGSTEGSITVYCVECGVKGEIQVSGTASFSISDGVTALSVGMDGSLEAGINLGVEAEIKYTFPAWSTDLATPQGVPLLEVEGVIVVGPIVELKAELELEVSAKGKVLTGVSISIPSFSANLDFVNTGNAYARGFDDIKVNKYFKAEGEIGASASLSMPYSVGVGISLPVLKWDKQIKLVEKPGIKAEVTYKVETSSGTVPTLGSSDEDENSCEGGITWDLKLVNEVDFNFFDVYESKIADYESPPIIEGCFNLSSSGNSSSSDYGNSLDTTKDTNTQSGTSMIDSTKKFTVVSASDGNLYLQGISAGVTTYFQPQNASTALTNSAATTLVADDLGRNLYIYYDSMHTYGVSRIRALAYDEVPSTATLVVIGFGDIDDNTATPDQYYISTSDQGTAYTLPYLPVACVITDGNGKNATKIFAVKNDVVSGMTTLTSQPELASTVTGGTVNSCVYLLLETWETK
ncbi:hypothetical protein MBLNU459_g1652t1 [Dothideomycetes sp. NU459]